MRSALLGIAAASLTLLASTVNAATSRTTWQQEALITDPVQECTSYNYQPVNSVIGSYPTIWATADLSAKGITSYDKKLFASINASIPNIAPRGTRAGNFKNVTYNTNTDPDCWWTATRCTQPKLSGLVADITKCDEPNTWGFTLDDGPNCSHNAYFDYLNTIDQKATLFYIGSNVADWPLEGQRGLADGHEICSHTWSHPYMTAMTNEQAFAELYYSKKIIKDVLGITVRCWRPPYGDVDDRIRFIADALDVNVETSQYTYPNYAQYVAGTHSIALAAPTAVSKDVKIQLSASPTSVIASATKVVIASDGVQQASSSLNSAAVSTASSATAHSSAPPRRRAARKAVVGLAALVSAAAWLVM
ncbi:glycoside hydrolase/deacetylase [Meredithblackwellia eburnea MCA 4105]